VDRADEPGVVSAPPQGQRRQRVGLPVIAATPGRSSQRARLAAGVLFNEFHQARAAGGGHQPDRRGPAGHLQPENQPAIFIEGQAFTVVGIIANDPGCP
jgi:hypothetical protein